MNKKRLHSIFLMVTLLMTSVCHGFGIVVDVEGDATALNINGDVRTLVKGAHIEAQETVITAADSEVLIKTSRQHYLLLKPLSKVVLLGEGQSKQSSVVNVRLAEGGLYGEMPTNDTLDYYHHVITQYGKAKLHRAHYHLTVTNRANEAATFVKVLEGRGQLNTRDISVNLETMDTAVAARGELPRLLAIDPDDLFDSARLESQIQQSKNPATIGKTERSAEASLAHAEVTENCAQDSPAQKMLTDFIQAYERGDIAYVQRRLDPSMIGYSALLSNMMKDVNVQKQMRFLFQNKNVQCGPDLAVINFRWEKRFLDLATFRPRLQSGQAAVLTHLKQGEWKLSGVSGDNPFAPQLTRPTTLIVSPKSTRINVIGTLPIPSQIRLISPDLAGAGTIQVEAIASTGDSELLTLTEVQPGMFSRTNFNVIDTASAPNDGVIEVNLGGTTTITFRYRNLKSGLLASDVMQIVEF